MVAARGPFPQTASAKPKNREIALQTARPHMAVPEGRSPGGAASLDREAPGMQAIDVKQPEVDPAASLHRAAPEMQAAVVPSPLAAAATGYAARIVLDSVAVHGGRLTTMEVRYPRFVHSEMMTHRLFSRNAASSRAIPVRKMIEAVRADPALPISWGRNRPGMSAGEVLDPERRARAEAIWREALAHALDAAERLAAEDVGVHKQLVNRLLEPFAWITVIITASEWSNFFTQRCHPDAQPEIRAIAERMLAAYRASVPVTVASEHWHLPLILDDERGLAEEELRRISVARCARVSYLTHDGTRDHAKDLALYDRLVEGGANGHWSPFEHVATPLAEANRWSGNFRGWEQLRKRFPDEHATTLPGFATS